MSFDMNKMLKEAQRMQEELAKVQEEAAGEVVQASAGGGMVTIAQLSAVWACWQQCSTARCRGRHELTVEFGERGTDRCVVAVGAEPAVEVLADSCEHLGPLARLDAVEEQLEVAQVGAHLRVRGV